MPGLELCPWQRVLIASAASQQLHASLAALDLIHGGSAAMCIHHTAQLYSQDIIILDLRWAPVSCVLATASAFLMNAHQVRTESRFSSSAQVGRYAWQHVSTSRKVLDMCAAGVG